MEPYRKPGRLLYSSLPLSSAGGICVYDGQRRSPTDVSTDLNIVLLYSKYNLCTCLNILVKEMVIKLGKCLSWGQLFI